MNRPLFQHGPLLDQRDVCELLRLSPKSIQKLRRAGKLQSYVFGHRTVRFRQEDVQKFIEQRKAER